MYETAAARMRDCQAVRLGSAKEPAVARAAASCGDAARSTGPIAAAGCRPSLLSSAGRRRPSPAATLRRRGSSRSSRQRRPRVAASSGSGSRLSWSAGRFGRSPRSRAHGLRAEALGRGEPGRGRDRRRAAWRCRRARGRRRAARRGSSIETTAVGSVDAYPPASPSWSSTVPERLRRQRILRTKVGGVGREEAVLGHDSDLRLRPGARGRRGGRAGASGEGRRGTREAGRRERERDDRSDARRARYRRRAARR